MDDFERIFAPPSDTPFAARYDAQCHCGTVRYHVYADPVDAKICHCVMCQRLHGAPMQWAAIFHKHDVRFSAGLDHLRFFNGSLLKAERILPCKVSCNVCGAPIADEGRNMWLAFPSLFDFGAPPKVPAAFKPTCHIFYGSRVFDMNDGLPKWAGHKDVSARCD
ncbi:MAG: GFA family protein [Alphaproteobacteria bacterium]|nr:GFA family protein [Alphaproteobacteria bacterium]